MFEKLFEKGKIGDLEIKNRIVMAPMGGTYLANMGFDVSERQLDYYAERARGGVGLIITEAVYVTEKRALPIRLLLSSARYIAGMYDLTRTVHKYGAKIAVQLSAGHGPEIHYPETELVAASPVRSFGGAMARSLDKGEVEELVQNFGDASIRAKMAGFDAIEIHGHGGYLLATFMSASLNKRKDKYGGDFEGRMRFPLEIVKCIQKSVSNDFPIIFRYALKDFVKGGREIEEAQTIAKRLERAGVQAIHGDAGRSMPWFYADSGPAMPWFVPPTYFPQGCLVNLTNEIKNVVKIPVIAVGNIREPAFAEGILREGKADFVAIGRGLLADPEWPNKAKSGRTDEILRCISCNEGCIGNIFSRRRVSCALNPAVGREREYMIKPAERVKKVFVAGGGPAGMEAARILALRGHKVTLYEKSQAVGGNLTVASKPAFKEPMRSVIKYLSSQIKKAGVEIRTGKELTLEEVKRAKPDVVIVATGAKPLIPNVSGIDGKNVFTAIDVLQSPTLEEVGKTVVVVGGGLVGCETGLYLAREGRNVTIVEMREDIASDTVIVTKMALMQMLTEEDVKIMKNAKLLKITERGIIVTNTEKKTVIADTIVLACGLEPNQALFRALENKVPELYAIGDCATPRKLMDAIHEGASIGRIV